MFFHGNADRGVNEGDTMYSPKQIHVSESNPAGVKNYRVRARSTNDPTGPVEVEKIIAGDGTTGDVQLDLTGGFWTPAQVGRTFFLFLAEQGQDDSWTADSVVSDDADPPNLSFVVKGPADGAESATVVL
jgi:hypothetical protein